MGHAGGSAGCRRRSALLAPGLPAGLCSGRPQHRAAVYLAYCPMCTYALRLQTQEADREGSRVQEVRKWRPCLPLLGLLQAGAPSPAQRGRSGHGALSNQEGWCPRLRLLPPEGSAGSELHPAVPGAEQGPGPDRLNTGSSGHSRVLLGLPGHVGHQDRTSLAAAVMRGEKEQSQREPLLPGLQSPTPAPHVPAMAPAAPGSSALPVTALPFPRSTTC